MKLKKLTEQILSEQSFLVLREIGRVIGVKAPASKRKEQLIKEIIAIQLGEMQPTTPSGKGAPTKTAVDISNFLEDENPAPIETPNENIENVNPNEFKPYPDNDNQYLTLHDRVQEGEIYVEGILEVNPKGYGFLRVNNCDCTPADVFVSNADIKKYNLRRGDKVGAIAKEVRENDLPALQKVEFINDFEPNVYKSRSYYETLIPCYPNKRLNLEVAENKDTSMRIIDLFAPVGMGQRGLIVAPPKTGKTTLIKKMAKAIEQNHPKVHLIVLLIDERPEEVTDIKTCVKSEVYYSTFDQSAEHHVRIAELILDRAKRLVESKQDVVILMDSITRLARAYNNVVEPSGRTLSGGIDPTALYGPKKFFGAARKVDCGGSLTILSTALVDTGSRMDDIIYEEFKGTGNMEIFLSRELSEKRIFPAIDLYKSGTRHDELLLSEKELDAVYKLRRLLAENKDSTTALIDMINKTENNEEFVAKLDSWLKIYGNK